MRINSVQQKKNLQFGSILTKLRQVDIPEGSGVQVRTLLTEGVAMKRLREGLFVGVTDPAARLPYSKAVVISDGEITCRLNHHKDPRKEGTFERCLKELMGEDKVLVEKDPQKIKELTATQEALLNQ